MTTELYWLTMTILLTVLLWFLWGANSNLSCHGQLIQTTAMVLPVIVMQSSDVSVLLSDSFGRRSTIECSVSSVCVVIFPIEIQFPLQIKRAPEKYMIEKLSS